MLYTQASTEAVAQRGCPTACLRTLDIPLGTARRQQLNTPKGRMPKVSLQRLTQLHINLYHQTAPRGLLPRFEEFTVRKELDRPPADWTTIEETTNY